MKNQLKYELQHLIFGNERLVPENPIRTIAQHLRRSKGTSTSLETTEFTKKQEEEVLTNWLDTHNLWVQAIDENLYLAEGAEQKVYFESKENIVLKVNTGVFYLFWEDYLYSLLLHNYFFPATAYTLIGFWKTTEGLCAVVKQRYVRKTEPTDLTQIRCFLESNGFQNNRNNDYIHPELGIILEDLHDENVLVNKGGLFVIDSVFYLTEAFYEGFEG